MLMLQPIRGGAVKAGARVIRAVSALIAAAKKPRQEDENVLANGRVIHVKELEKVSEACV